MPDRMYARAGAWLLLFFLGACAMWSAGAAGEEGEAEAQLRSAAGERVTLQI